MNFNFRVLIFIIFLPLVGWAQKESFYIPPKSDSITLERYNRFLTQLKHGQAEKNMLKCYNPNYNIVCAYRELKAQQHVIYEASLDCLRSDSVGCCKFMFRLTGDNVYDISYSFKDKKTIAYFRKVCDSVYKRIDSNLIRKLIKIEERDQKIRGKHTLVEINTNDRLREEMVHLDTLNLTEIDAIIKECGGYPSKKLVGDTNNDVIYLVILHSPLNTQEQYLPLIRKAVFAGELVPNYLATLEDRILFIKNKPQLYGTQISYDKAKKQEALYKWVGTLEDLEKRRDFMGMEPLKNYLRRFNLEYPPKP
ncbi:MAG: hypothetical protein IPO14_08700 [Saprospiraceae bacterium]|nr:hypothetical protein [Saprospiraceae bacterium]